MARPRSDVWLEVDVDGVDDEYNNLPPTIQRIGGEGKLAGISINAHLLVAYNKKVADKIDANSGRFKLVSITPTFFKNKYFPDGFSSLNAEAELKGIKCKLVSACIGKAQKIGGWDLVKKTSKEMLSYVPAGSVYSFETTGIKGSEIAQKLNSDSNNYISLGKKTDLGYGKFIIGTW